MLYVTTKRLAYLHSQWQAIQSVLGAAANNVQRERLCKTGGWEQHRFEATRPSAACPLMQKLRREHP